jgi:mRNA-degrading endonuclease RelE of RelBE toxin-antitoxin system
VRFGTSDAAKGWDELCSHAPGNTRDAWLEMRTNPRPPKDRRHMRLHGDLGTKLVEGRDLEVWQIEVTGAGRIWYAVDDDNRTVWIVQAGPGHPKRTE